MSRTVRYKLRGVAFEWDAAKADANLVQHGVPFERACEVFFDPFARIVDATEPDETRDAAIGRTESQALLFVVHVIRHAEIIRIISARHATPQERRTFEQF
ncbi:MAG: BrnT family toxin [Betaproteobacteria bacterium]|nr:BrnT family toxin [Betaproteobacteria bacterium]